MNDGIICQNPDCKAKNPLSAKFCRLCGQPLVTSKDDFTLGIFADIPLRPIAFKPVHFVNKADKCSFYLLPLLLISLYLLHNYFKEDFLFEFDSETYENVIIFGVLLSIILFVIFIYGIKHFIRWSNFTDNADYIEESFFMYKMKRIAKNKKLGLFDNKSKRILLLPEYDLINKYDDNHIHIGKDRKVGLYSIPLKKIVVPVCYDGVGKIKNGVIEVVKNSHLSYYDTHGNVLK